MKLRTLLKLAAAAMTLPAAVAVAATPAAAKDIAAMMAVFSDNPAAPKVAPRGYDVTIIEYFDYACPYCKRMEPVFEQLLASDRKVRIVYRDWPILRPESRTAARLAIASQWQGKHAAFHDALLGLPGRLTDDAIRAAANSAGVDWARLQRDAATHSAEIDKLLAETEQHADILKLSGTPALLVGDHLLRGAVDLDMLKRIVGIVRAEQNAKG